MVLANYLASSVHLLEAEPWLPVVGDRLHVDDDPRAVLPRRPFDRRSPDHRPTAPTSRAGTAASPPGTPAATAAGRVARTGVAATGCPCSSSRTTSARDRKSVVEGKGGDLGGRRLIQKKKKVFSQVYRLEYAV